MGITATPSAGAMGSLCDALQSAYDACAAEAAARRVAIALDEPPAVCVGIDADQLTLVLVNLIDNAVKHGRPGGGVFVGVELADVRVVRVTVDDDGPGVEPDARERVFGFGERGATEAGGTGIGLALARLMLERAGGMVDLEVSPLGGARFIVSLPRL